MQTARRRPLTRYRNEVVFRSAERLIASRKPTRKRLPRWSVFLSGALLGALLTTIFARQLWLRSHPVATTSAWLRGIDATIAGIDWLPRRTTAVAENPVDASSPPNKPTRDLSAPPNADVGSGLTERLRTFTPTATTPDRRGTLEKSINVGGGTTSTRITVGVSPVTFRGELQFNSGPAIAVEFVLRRSANSQDIDGVIRYLEDNVCIVLFTLKGSIAGQTLLLQEIGKPWVMHSSKPASHPAVFAGGRKFAITLPELTGTWSLRDTSGTLSL